MSRRRKAGYWMLLIGLAISGAIYCAELVFRHGVASHAVPRTERAFNRAIAAQWPRPVAPTKSPETIRILGLADSFGLAGGSDNYHYQLERLLRERGHDVEMVNLSVAGYSLHQELRLLKRFGADYRPDVVLHGFFVGNDFAPQAGESMRYRGIDVDLAPGLGSWLPQNLVLPRWIVRWQSAVGERRQRDAEQIVGEERSSFSREAFLRVQRVRLSTCRRPTRDGLAWPRVVEVLDEIGREAERIGAARVMVVHPDQFQVEPALAAEIMREYELSPADYDLDLPQRFLRTYADSRRVSLLDLTAELRRAGADGGMYLRRDTHYNAAGNRLAAEAIADRLEPLLHSLAEARRRAGWVAATRSH